MGDMWNAVARFCCRHAVLVIVAWVALAIAGNVLIPQIETVVRDHSRTFLPPDSSSSVAVQRMGELFAESASNNVAYLVLEGDHELGTAEREYYTKVVDRLAADTQHVQWVMDLWSKPLSMAVSQSVDKKSAYVQLRLAGQIGTTEGENSVEAVRRTATDLIPPAGLHVYTTGPGPTVADELNTIDDQLIMLIVGTALVIAILMFLAYRSAVTSRIPLIPVAIALAVARPVVALLGSHGAVEISIFSVNLAASMTLGAVANYGIFMIGRYHELRRAHVDPEEAVVKAFRKVAPVITASALTITFALCSLSIARLGLLRSAGLACAISIAIGTFAALTLLPALISLAGKRGLAEPRPPSTRKRWRRVGVVVARWPRPMLAVGVGALLVCALPAVTMKMSFNESKAQPSSTESNRGYQAMDRHFPANRLLPEIVIIESDHDLRTPKGLIALESVTRKIMDIPQVQMVQSASRPAGTPMSESALTTQVGQVGDQVQDRIDSAGSRASITEDLSASIAELSGSIDGLQAQLADGVGGLRQIRTGAEGLAAATLELQDVATTLSGLLQPARDSIASNPTCSADPGCRLLQAVVEPADGVLSTASRLSASAGQLGPGLDSAAHAIEGSGNALASVQVVLTQARTSIGELSGTMDRLRSQATSLTEYLGAMGQDFDGSGQGGFYFPQRAIDDDRYVQVSRLFFSPNQRATRLLVYGDGEMFGNDGAALSGRIADAFHAATKEGNLANATILTTGVGSVVNDLKQSARHDFQILAGAALILVFLVVLLMLRAPIAAVVVVSTVMLSYCSAIGLSVLFWQHLFGRELHWAVPTISFIALVAVGSDYNLLMTARLKEERASAPGLRTAMIRTFDGTGGVVTTAGIVFALTMFALWRVDILSIAQVGTTTGIGLLLDSLIVRTLLVPALAVLFGQWFWWPFRIFDKSSNRGPTRIPVVRIPKG
jgi:RND superfamily putative drug exporter